jgi:hypothetical protein
MTQAQTLPREDFARIASEMAAAMPVVARSMNPATEDAGRRNVAAKGLRALLDAGYVPVRPVQDTPEP